MLSLIVKQFSIYICCLYLYYRLLAIQPASVRRKLLNFTAAVCMACCSAVVKQHLPAASMLFSISILYIFILLQNHSNLSTSFVTVSIAFGLSYAAFTFSSFIVVLCSAPLFRKTDFFPILFLTVCSFLLEYGIVHIPFQIKRMRKGMPFLYDNKFIYFGMFSSIAIIFCITIGQLYYSIDRVFKSTTLIFILFLLLALVIWWRDSITKTYLDKLHRQETASLHNEISSLKHTLRRLQEDNEQMSKILHKDNKLIPSMESAVSDFLACNVDLSSEEAKRYGESLIDRLHSMYEERSEFLMQKKKPGGYICQSGLCSLDAILSFMHEKSVKQGISLNIEFDAAPAEFVPRFITEEDLTHLSADLLENAIIAVKDSSIRKIQVCFRFVTNNFILEISDSGSRFDLEVLKDFGLKKHTTHQSAGGSGIGLMDIWQLKKKYHASLQISESAESESDFTKKISLIFDGKDQYLICSPRCSELQTGQLRSDLYVCPAEGQNL